MTQQDKREMFRHSLTMLVLHAHKHGMSWKKLHEDLSVKTTEVWQQHRTMLNLFPENAKHSEIQNALDRQGCQPQDQEGQKPEG